MKRSACLSFCHIKDTLTNIPLWNLVDLYALIDQRILGRLRFLQIAQSTEWEQNEGAEIGALESLLDELDKENWEQRRWHYEFMDLSSLDTTYDRWIIDTAMGREMRPRLTMLRNR